MQPTLQARSSYKPHEIPDGSDSLYIRMALAIRNGDPDVVRALLDLGANVA